VKGVLGPEKAQKIQDDAMAYLESFGLGFDRNDKSTWVPEKMPYYYKGGLIYCYGSGHEQFIWDIKWVGRQSLILVHFEVSSGN
jgi:hypothetical protein